MNRLAFVTNQKIKRMFSVVETLSIGSVWKSLDGTLHTRIKKYKGIESGKYVFDTETCIYPRWFKKNNWRYLEWRVDDIYIRHEFPKQYERVRLIEPARFNYGFRKKYIPRYIALIGAGLGVLSLTSYFLHPTPINWLKIVGWISLPINIFGYYNSPRVEKAIEAEFPLQRDDS